MNDPNLQRDIQRALNYGYFYLKFRPRSCHEVEVYLGKKAEKRQWLAGAVEGAVQSLKEDGYINDREFIDWFVTSRSRSKQKGIPVLKGELMKFGISRDLVQEYFEEHEQDEEQMALQALVKKWPRLSGFPEEKRFQKAASFLMRRGFSYDLVKKSIAKLTQK